MLPEQWEIFKRAARLEKLDKIPMALIIDSPWMRSTTRVPVVSGRRIEADHGDRDKIGPIED